MRSYFAPLSLLLVVLLFAFFLAMPGPTVYAQGDVCVDPKTGKQIDCPKKRPTVIYPSFTPTLTYTPIPTATKIPTATLTPAPVAVIPPASGNETSPDLPVPAPAQSRFILIGLLVGGASLLGLALWRASRGIVNDDNAPGAGSINNNPPGGDTTMNNNETSMNSNETSMNNNETSMNSNEGGISFNTEDGGTSMNNNE